MIPKQTKRASVLGPNRPPPVETERQALERRLRLSQVEASIALEILELRQREHRCDPSDPMRVQSVAAAGYYAMRAKDNIRIAEQRLAGGTEREAWAHLIAALRLPESPTDPIPEVDLITRLRRIERAERKIADIESGEAMAAKMAARRNR